MSDESRIAIIGMAGRFPRSPDLRAYWKNLRDGVECTRELGDAELLAAGVPPDVIADPRYVKSAAVLERMEQFDAGFFGFSPRDASIMDPQHRHFLECSWEALEDGGHDPARFDGSIGVFGGSGHNAYLPFNLLTNPDLMESVGFFLVRHTGNDKDFLTTRVSYCLNLKGPSVAVQTACSTSLVAIHMACQSLLSGECDMALAGGVTIEMPHHRGYRYEEGEILSPDGHCRAFDHRSQGTIFSSGVGVVLLRRLGDAVKARDRVRAVILGSAVNNDGSLKVGYLAPSVDGQAAAITEALAVADVDASTLSYVEAHGTGTPVGDPIEIAALTRAFRESTDEVGFCGIGSVKTNIGHADTAAGVASLIKVVHALEHRELPPSLHFEKPNPAIDFARSPFRVNARLGAWTSGDGQPRRAGVNALGVGGTNAFVVLEEAPAPAAAHAGRKYELLVTSARGAAAADSGLERLGAHLAEERKAALGDVAFTLQTGRRAFAHRRALVCESVTDAADALKSRDPRRILSQVAPDQAPRLTFMFPGGGAQYPGMGRELYELEPVYRRHMDECLDLLRPKIGDLKRLLYPSDAERSDAATQLERPSLSLPALFATEYALAKLWMSWGVAPAAMVGHSMGEYTAACLASVFSLADALSLVATRGELFEKVAPGSMLSVPMSAQDLTPLLDAAGAGLGIAAINGTSICVASGPTDAVLELQRSLAAREIDAQRIHISVAAHSSMLDSILPEFGRFTRTIRYSEPRIPFLSNVTGAVISAREATDPEYWVRHLRSTVRFSDCMRQVLSEPNQALLEVGPGRALSTFARAQASELGSGAACLSSLRHAKEEVSDLAYATGVLGRLWCAGVAVDWSVYHGDDARRRVPLPTYPWEHQRYWIEPGAARAAVAAPTLQKKADLADWFYHPSWRRAPLHAATSTPLRFLLIAGEPWCASLKHVLQTRGHSVVTIVPGTGWERIGEDAFRVDVCLPDAYERVLSELGARDWSPDRLLHLLALSDEAPPRLGMRDGGFAALLALAQALGGAPRSAVLEIGVVSQRMQQVAGEQVLHPEQATMLGPCKVMMQELALVATRSIDVDHQPGAWQRELLVRQLVAEMEAASGDRVVALRGHDRLVQSFEPLRLAAPEAKPEAGRLGRDGGVRREGVYLITGGLGGIGLALAEHLAVTWRAKLVLVGRQGLPPRAEWPAWLMAKDVDDPVSVKLRRVIEMERAGAQVLIVAADVADAAAMTRVVEQARAELGALNGVFHTAGVLDDGVIALKSIEAARAVLAPKIAGAEALDLAVGERPLDFMVLFSSVSSITGLAGQVDYAAANAFLDAFAHARMARTGQRTIAIDWNAWRDVGMAADLASTLGVMAQAPRAPAGRPTGHPWIERCLKENEHARTYGTLMSAERQWVLGEHRLRSIQDLGGHALLPGTAYLELARAAFAEPSQAPHQPCELRDVVFTSPFMLDGDELRELRVTLEQTSAGMEFVISGGQAPDWTEHAHGTIRALDTPPPADVSLSAIAARCTQRTRPAPTLEDEPHVAFGPRWDNRVETRYGDREALMELRLPEAFASDVAMFALHPALVDFATAGAQDLVRGFDPAIHFYVPVSYGHVRVHQALPAHVYSHLRLRTGGPDDPGAKYDVTLYDEAGRTLVEISEFAMRRVSSAQLSVTSGAGRRAAGGGAAPQRQSTANNILELGLREGILAAEGMAALERVLGGPALPQVVVSSQDLGALLASTRVTTTVSDAPAATAAGARASLRTPRPPLATAYAAPASDLEKTIAGVFEELLGVEGVGRHDDFFDLGGHSLLLTQLVSRVRKQTASEISLRSLFEERTIEGIGAAIEAGRASGAKPAPALTRVSRDAYRVKRSTLALGAGVPDKDRWH